MSSDIYIPLSVVLSHPAQFQLKAALNVEYETLVDGVDFNMRHGDVDDIDWDYIKSGLQPVLLCKFGARDIWMFVNVVTFTSVITADGIDLTVSSKYPTLHVSCAGEVLAWLKHWLLENEFDHEVLE